ncbi:hypothetical protein F2Q69_00028610 [Brassica cretica]|uniref:Uncharacterized protein n=1 Tax=Brassica cretica TaxID=69181 RepID=A0A8S9SAA4_BRACR|nr:hypothetical protein F2Q69_00028610 [Brassica cretica]
MEVTASHPITLHEEDVEKQTQLTQLKTKVLTRCAAIESTEHEITLIKCMREVRTTDQELRFQAKTPCQQVVLKTLRINIEIKKESPKRSSYAMVVVPIHFK